MKKITFPKIEKSDVKNKLKAGEQIVTTRVSKDQGRYSAGERIEYAGFLLRVVKVETFDKLEEHPFGEELDGKIKRDIERMGEFDVIWLEVAK